MSIVNVQNLTHAYGDKSVFRSVSFRLLAGERVGLVGANGAGKSTLLRILTGELIPDEGTVEWIPNVRIGHLEQHIDLKPGETIRDYLHSAFAELFAMEKEMQEAAERMSTAVGVELERLLQRYSQLQEALDIGDFYQVDSKVEEVADGLGLMDLGMERRVDQLSGGQRTKLLLAKLLLEQPQALLLDEPTNYLDTEHIVWLTGYLQQYPHAFILISHDSAFMNEVVNLVYHLEHQLLNRYVGKYAQFTAAYELRKHQVHNAFNKQQEEVKKLETYIQKNKARASTAKLAKSREKRLDKIERIDKPTGNPRPRFAFRVGTEPVGVVMEAKRLKVGYDRPLMPELQLQIKRGDKIALIGCNGVGKSTCLRTFLGMIPSLDGDVRLGDRVLPSYFAQEDHSFVEYSALEEIWRAYPHMTQKEVRGALARCGLKSEHIWQPLKTLSGGEQSKVRLCRLMLSDSNWMVLDEPTNHLDAAAKESLREALIAYTGTILLVSHEPSFYAGWTTAVWNADEWAGQTRNV